MASHVSKTVTKREFLIVPQCGGILFFCLTEGQGIFHIRNLGLEVPVSNCFLTLCPWAISQNYPMYDAELLGTMWTNRFWELDFHNQALPYFSSIFPTLQNPEYWWAGYYWCAGCPICGLTRPALCLTPSTQLHTLLPM